MEYRKRTIIRPGEDTPEAVSLFVGEPTGAPGEHIAHSELTMIHRGKRRGHLSEINREPGPSKTSSLEHINKELTYLNRFVNPGEQQSLFHYESPQSGFYELNYLSGSRIGRIHSMNLIGIAKGIADDQGLPLKPSSDLSKHSLNLVEGLAKRGLVDATDVPSRPSNTLTFREGQKRWGVEDTHSEIVSSEEIARGRQTIRNLLRSSRPESPSHKVHPDQLQLDL